MNDKSTVKQNIENIVLWNHHLYKFKKRLGWSRTFNNKIGKYNRCDQFRNLRLQNTFRQVLYTVKFQNDKA